MSEQQEDLANVVNELLEINKQISDARDDLKVLTNIWSLTSSEKDMLQVVSIRPEKWVGLIPIYSFVSMELLVSLNLLAK